MYIIAQPLGQQLPFAPFVDYHPMRSRVELSEGPNVLLAPGFVPMAAAEKQLAAAEAGKLPAAPPIALARWGSLRPQLRRVTFGEGGRDYSATFEPDEAAPAMADVVRRARLLSVQQVRRLADPINSVDEMLFDKTLKERGLSRDDFDARS